MAKSAEQLRVQAKEFREKAKALDLEADKLDELEDLKLVRELKKRGKLEAAKGLISD